MTVALKLDALAKTFPVGKQIRLVPISLRNTSSALSSSHTYSRFEVGQPWAMSHFPSCSVRGILWMYCQRMRCSR